MKTITNQQIYEKWEQIPELLKEAFVSPEQGEMLWSICEQIGLDEDMITQVAIVVGNVVLGFVHPNDMASEIQSIPDMDRGLVDKLVFEIDRKMLADIKDDIMKIAAAPAAPKVIEAAPAVEKKEAVVVEQMTQAVPAIGRIAEVAPAELPKPIAEVKTTGMEMEMPKPVEMAGMPGGLPSAEAQKPMEAPAMLHTEAELKPIAQKRRSLTSFGGLFGLGRRTERKEAPVVAAQVSLSGVTAEAAQPQIAKTEQPKVRVVHYTGVAPAMSDADIFGKGISAEQPAAEASGVSIAKEEVKAEGALEFEPKVVDLTAPQQPAEAQKEAGVAAVSAEANVEEPIRPETTIDLRAISAPTEADVKHQEKELEQPIMVPKAIPQEKEPEKEIVQPVRSEQPKEAPAQAVSPMKTPQRVEVVGQISGLQRPEHERVHLAEIPVSGEVVDLRTLEKIEADEQPIAAKA